MEENDNIKVLVKENFDDTAFMMIGENGQVLVKR